MSSTAKIIDSTLESPCIVHEGATIVRSVTGRFFGLGLFSFVADCDVGSFCTFGSRCSIGAFSHPLTLFSCHEIAYRDTTKIYGETMLRTEELEPIRRNRTSIGHDVYVGDNVVIIGGVTIETGAVIGAGSVVTGDVESYSVMVGNPARKLRRRFDDELCDELYQSKWWEWSLEEIRTRFATTSIGPLRYRSYAD
jgi:acetyltransferase-like isoleucine patch superfamily enzyme